MNNIPEELAERYDLSVERIRSLINESSDEYFAVVARYIMYVLEPDDKVSKRERNEKIFQEILPEKYENSFLNPEYAAEKLGRLGSALSYLFSEIYTLPMLLADEKIFDVVILLELFLEIHTICEEKPVNIKAVEEALYYYNFDYAEELVRERTEDTLIPSENPAYKICMEADLTTEDYLYDYGEYIGDNERGISAYLAKQSQEKIDSIAATFVNGFRKGFVTMNVPFEGKKSVFVTYSIGQERIVRAAIKKFNEIGLDTIIGRYAVNRVNRRQIQRRGFTNISFNMQYDYDHRCDDALFLNKRFIERKLDVLKRVYEEYKEEASVYAGIAVIESFGENTVAPVTKDAAISYDDAQQELYIEYATRSGAITNEYLPGDKVSFTIIAFPVPDVHEKFEEVFEETVKLNTLDNDKYTKIHQHIIDALDLASYVKVEGRNGNCTDIRVEMRKLNDPMHESQFENCVADVNIPVGEVFTSPVLEGTNGMLHVSHVYLNGLLYKDLKMEFKDGCVASYTCENFDDEEKNKSYIKENVLQNRETLPLGEFAIGTNTAAYKMGNKYDIMGKLPILIMEKTGPHFAVGDTCYRHSEDTRIFNPDGKEIVSKENSFSMKRNTEPDKAYFNCHTDITIPFDELGRIYAVYEDGSEVDIILNGKFVLPGTEELNEDL
ncbi:aminopeptidase [Eubacterium sp.]|uniref:aminopeptidase n=1 Tax=Eubacterium sp. TaxID=142586 RepID=UPI0025861895|nr:aminopeptidase [Eubacterium sp.]